MKITQHGRVFEWDDAKNMQNLDKHQLGFTEIISIFFDTHLTRIDDRQDYGEVREITLGKTEQHIVVVAVHTDRDGSTRIISARHANKKERAIYTARCMS